jgi:hypothetical protein
MQLVLTKGCCVNFSMLDLVVLPSMSARSTYCVPTQEILQGSRSSPIWANGSIEYTRQIVHNWRELAPGMSSFMRLSRSFAVIQALVWQTVTDEHPVSQPVLRLLRARRICAPLYNFKVRMMRICLSRVIQSCSTAAIRSGPISLATGAIIQRLSISRC